MPTASSNRIIPKEQFMAWQRWHPGALPEEETPARATAREAEEESVAAIRSRAYATGFTEGQRAGFLAGQKEGRAEGRKLGMHDAATLRQVAASATQALQSLGDVLARKTLVLATVIARKMLQRDIEEHPESILNVVREALTLLPENTERVRLLVHADDAELVREFLAQSDATLACTVVGTPDVKKGGCFISAPGGDIDATLDTRWARLMQTLGDKLGEPQDEHAAD